MGDGELFARLWPKLLDEAVEAVHRLPSAEQDDIARTIMHLAGSDVAAGRMGQARPMRLSYILPALTDLTSILDYIADRRHATVRSCATLLSAVRNHSIKCRKSQRSLRLTCQALIREAQPCAEAFRIFSR